MAILFEYFCDKKRHGGCGYKFEEYYSTEDRNLPLGAPCPECGKKGSVCRAYSAKLYHHVINGRKKMGEDFKEVMTRIKKEHPVMETEHF